MVRGDVEVHGVVDPQNVVVVRGVEDPRDVVDPQNVEVAVRGAVGHLMIYELYNNNEINIFVAQ